MIRPPPLARLWLVPALCLVSAACGTSGTSGSSASDPASASTHVAVIYRSRCGGCHRPVAPGSQPLDRLHAALLKHRKRTHLTEAEWVAIEAFLAPPEPSP